MEGGGTTLTHELRELGSALGASGDGEACDVCWDSAAELERLAGVEQRYAEALREAVIELEGLHESLFIASEKGGLTNSAAGSMAAHAKKAALKGGAALAGEAGQ